MQKVTFVFEGYTYTGTYNAADNTYTAQGCTFDASKCDVL